jgi:hypothetical protein
MVLYRAVSRAEFDDILFLGYYRSLPGQMEGKWFAESPADARKWAERLGGVDSVIVSAVAPDSIARALFRIGMLDGVGPARYATEDQLLLLRPVTDDVDLAAGAQ